MTYNLFCMSNNKLIVILHLSPFTLSPTMLPLNILNANCNQGGDIITSTIPHEKCMIYALCRSNLYILVPNIRSQVFTGVADVVCI